MIELTRICDGVFLNEGDAIGPERIVHCGVTLTRFMDRFYLRCSTDALTPIEVSELCRARIQHPDTIQPPNQHVRALFKSFILEVRPKNFLEIGAGTNPILAPDEAARNRINAFLADADPDNDGAVFSGSSPALPYASGAIDLAAAVFVLHFHFYENQILELHRCMSQAGLFIANVYKRGQLQRTGLAEALRIGGFHLKTFEDPRKLCTAHEYWIASKSEQAASHAATRLQLLAINQDLT